MSGVNVDDDAVLACADLVGRTGATGLVVGHLDDDVPVEQARWYAYAEYRGSRITEEAHRGPVEAMEALARRLLTGAWCRCGRLVALSDAGAVAYPSSTMSDGSKWTAEQAKAAGMCRWTRVGPRWEMGCR